MNLSFVKMHGLGNDFILIDCRDDASGVRSEKLGELSRRLCHRRFGIGADQVLLLYNSEKADFRMRIFNADGSEVEMCGNGIRCLAKYIWDRGLSGKEALDIETAAGIIRPEKAGDLVKVDMGEPVLDARSIPVDYDGRVEDFPLNVLDREFRITCVSMGNPHAVIVVDDADRFDVAGYGPLIERHGFFPNRTNVEFIQVLDRARIRMRVWERGAGETMACGTGASAAAVAAHLNGLADRRVTVVLNGGELVIEWKDDNHVYMTGPAVEVFAGRVNLIEAEGKPNALRREHV
jgi:diaminopimelate epimerase